MGGRHPVERERELEVSSDELDDDELRERRLEVLDDLVCTGRDVGVSLVGYSFTSSHDGTAEFAEVLPTGELRFAGRVSLDD